LPPRSIGFGGSERLAEAGEEDVGVGGDGEAHRAGDGVLLGREGVAEVEAVEVEVGGGEDLEPLADGLAGAAALDQGVGVGVDLGDDEVADDGVT
jgi:hypothetical protein